MSDNNYGDLHAWIEPEIEARIVSAIVGEASDFERDELERLMDERPELRVFKRRLEAVHGLVGEAVKAEDGAEWRLPAKKRAELMGVLGGRTGGKGVKVMPEEAARERRIGKAGRRVLFMAAACFLATLILVPVLVGSIKGIEAARPAMNALGRLTDGRAEAEGQRAWGSKSFGYDMEAASGVVVDESAGDYLRHAAPAVATQPARPADTDGERRGRMAPGDEVRASLKRMKSDLGSVTLGVDGLQEDPKADIEIIREFVYPTEYEAAEIPTAEGQTELFSRAGSAAKGKPGEPDRPESGLRVTDGRQAGVAGEDGDRRIPGPADRIVAGTSMEIARPIRVDPAADEASLSVFGGNVAGRESGGMGGGGSGGGFLGDEQDAKEAALAEREAVLAEKEALQIAGDRNGPIVFSNGDVLMDEASARAVNGRERNDHSWAFGSTRGPVPTESWHKTPATNGPAGGSTEEIRWSDADPFAAAPDESPTGLKWRGRDEPPAARPETDDALSRRTKSNRNGTVDGYFYRVDQPESIPSPTATPAPPAASAAAKPVPVRGVRASQAPEPQPVPVPDAGGSERHEELREKQSELPSVGWELKVPEIAESGGIIPSENAGTGTLSLERGDSRRNTERWKAESTSGSDDADRSGRLPTIELAKKKQKSAARFQEAEKNAKKASGKDMASPEGEVEEIRETLQKQLELVENRLEKMGEVVGQRRDAAVDKALESHDYIEAKREYEQAQQMLQSIKLANSAKRIGLQIPKNPVTIHDVEVEQKRRGLLGLGGKRSEARATVQINPNVQEVDPFGGDEAVTGAYMTRQFFATEVKVIESEATLKKVVEDLQLAKRWEKSEAEAVRELKEAVEVGVRKGTDLLDIRVEGKDAEETKQIARKMAEAFKERRTVMEMDRAKRALDAINAEMRDQEDLVEEKRKVLDTIVQAVGIPYFEGVRGSGEIGRSEEDIYGIAERQLYKLEREKQQLDRQLKTVLKLEGEELRKYVAGLEIENEDTDARESLRRKRAAALGDEVRAEAEPFSTFSLHVSDVSFKLAQAALEKGQWPEAERIRVEEFVNALDYGDPAPSQAEKVACRVEQAAHPFLQQRNLLRVSMRTAALGRNAGTPLRLTVLLDNSGSMDRADRVESVRRAFELLAAQMNPQDELTLVSFARTPRLLRDRVPGDKVGELAKLLDQTPSEGGTNLEQALRLGVEKAKANFLDGAQNRIVLLTDGAANLGNAKPAELGALVETMRQEGIAFDACGVGAEGLNDEILESLTRKGDGRYYFLDRPEDADAGFARQIAGALRPAAKNVKVQVEFNPKRVGKYKLLGFEKHRLEKEDFRNDSVDAAEMAAEEEGVAVYQVEAMPDGEGEVGTVSVRFRDMDSGRMVERTWTIPYEANPARVADAAPSMQLAATAAMLAEKLKGSAAGEVVNLRDVERWTRNLQGVYPKNERVRQLFEMTSRARELAP